MTASEQPKIEFATPNYLCNIVVILSDMGLRYKKELLPMKKVQVDLENGPVHVADSKTVNGIGDMPMTVAPQEAFQRQIAETTGSEYLFPSPVSTGSKPHITNLRKTWSATLKMAGVPYFALYELRRTFATRLSAGGVADHMVTQMLRQSDAEVFKLDTTGHETVLYSFTGGADGGRPNAGVIRDSAGNLFGTTEYGGKRFTGVVFKVTP